ncbi:MAG: class I SAM-dependent methyltransferase [Kiritimatiellales bacterium]|nr:class I SAM-dependent methyltransferase [Kiritimatiellales bacterium]
MDANLRSEVIRWQEKLFKRSVRRQTRLRKIKEQAGITTGQNCLEITAGDGMISTRLREGGGRWKTLVTSSAAKASLEWFVDDPIDIFQAPAIKEADGTFDLVVIVDALERVRDDYAFIKECHRVLKPDGRLVITAARKMVFCLGGCPLRLMIGLSWRAKGLERNGYTSGEFFEVLKDGFDVPDTDTYSTCCIEVPGLLCEAAANKLARGLYNMPGEKTGTEEFYHYTKLNAFAVTLYPIMWLLAKLEDKLLFFIPGHNIIAKTKRRVWRARKQPILIDGRSIAEAAINTKIGTAAPF